MTKQPTADYPHEERFKLNRRIFKNPETTLLFRVPDDSMKGIKIRSGDILLVNRSLKPRDGHYVVVTINGEQAIRQISVCGDQIFIESLSGESELMRVGELGIELVGVATAFIPVIKEQNSTPLEAFMSDTTSFTHPRFVVLSLMNFYNRIVVGADGEVFTLEWQAVQELAGQQLVDQPFLAGSYRINDDQTIDIKTTIALPPPFSINIWSEPLLGVLAVYAYQEGSYYFWKPEW